MLIFETLADRLNSPRGLSFDGQGTLYIAEAGRGGGGKGPSLSSPNQPGAVLDYGPTGSIARWQGGQLDRPWQGLPSLAKADGSDAAGLHDLAIADDGTLYGLFGFASNPTNRDPSVICGCAVPQTAADLAASQLVIDRTIGVPDFGQLVRFDSKATNPKPSDAKTATWTKLVDLVSFEAANNPNGDDLNTNPYKFLLQGNEVTFIDSGANVALRSQLDGSGLRAWAKFPARNVASPFPTGDRSLSMQSVPTSLALGADGAFYVSELTGSPFPTGGARIYRLDPDGTPKPFVEGLTQAIDLDFDPKQGLYVLEYAAQSLLSGNLTGGLIYISPDGQRRDLASGGELVTPTAMTIGPDQALYIANRGFVAGQGQLVRAINGRQTEGTSGDDTLSGDRTDTAVPTPDNGLALGPNNDILIGRAGNDRLSGLSSADRLFGNPGNDTLSGGDGNDTLNGGRGPDLLFGDAGNDWLSGDRGSDTLTGGAGNDRFVLGNGLDGQGVDTITDFQPGQDQWVLPTGVTFAQLSLTAIEGGVQVAIDETAIAKVLGVDRSAISAQDVISFG